MPSTTINSPGAVLAAAAHVFTNLDTPVRDILDRMTDEITNTVRAHNAGDDDAFKQAIANIALDVLALYGINDPDTSGATLGDMLGASINALA